MYPLVGAINYRHRKTIDLTYGHLRLAIVTDQDLTKFDADSQKNFRTKLMAILGQDADVIKHLIAIHENFDKEQPSSPNPIVIFEGMQPVEVIATKATDLRYATDLSGHLTKLVQLPPLLPRLRVEVPYIVRADLGTGEERQVELKGVNLNNFQDIDKPTFDSARIYIDIAEKYGANLLRMMVDIDKAEANIVEFDKVTKYAELKGMYCIIVPSFKGFMQTPFMSPSVEVGNFMRKMAARYRSHPNVTYALLNELSLSVDWEREIHGLAQIATAITEANPDAVLFVPGGDWNRKFRAYLDNPYAFPFQNVVFDVHYYYRDDPTTGNDITESHFADLKSLIEKGKPVLIGEAGIGAARGGWTNPRDAEKIGVMIEMVKSNPKRIHYTGFVMATSGNAALLRRDYTPSPRGKLYFDDMQDPNSVQQTFFTK